MKRLAFIDTETTGLDPRTRRAWEVGLIIKTGEGSKATYEEYHWFVRVSLKDADPMALEVGKYYERHPDPYSRRPYTDRIIHHNGQNWNVVPEEEIASTLSRLLRGAYVVGAVPWFDAYTIEALLREYGHAPTWHYHLVDVETLAAGELGIEPPWDFDMILEKYKLFFEEGDRHTALGDARMASYLYDQVYDPSRRS